FSPDGTRVVSGSGDKSVRIWDVSTGEEKHKLDGHASTVTSVAFSPDGTRVVSCSYDKSVRIWDASTGEEKHKLDGHRDPVNSVAFSPDGKRVVSASQAKDVHLWNTITGKHELPLPETTSQDNVKQGPVVSMLTRYIVYSFNAFLR
ncbi:WD40-repeat-containing domain protein, partial [Pterulicium gracile]